MPLMEKAGGPEKPPAIHKTNLLKGSLLGDVDQTNVIRIEAQARSVLTENVVGIIQVGLDGEDGSASVLAEVVVVVLNASWAAVSIARAEANHVGIAMRTEYV